MTLAIGMLCEDGLLLMADTRLSYTDGSVAEAVKLKAFEAGDGVFAIVQSSEDFHAAESLVAELKEKLKGKPPKSRLDFIAIAKKVMGHWYVPVYENRPAVKLLVGFLLPPSVTQKQSSVQEDWGFYFCEPPNTVTFLHDKYKAIGDARIFTDPIYTTWFNNGPLPSLYTALCQASYMMHKAKKLHSVTVGGNTDTALLVRGSDKPLCIERLDMQDAEGRGETLDGILSRFAAIIMGASSDGPEEIARMGREVFQYDLSYTTLEFHCQFPDKTIRR
jgi:hypothetical protein